MIKNKKDEKIRKTEIIIARVAPDLHEKIKFWANKKHLPISRFAEMAFTNQLSEFENTYENLIEIINQQQLLINKREFLIKLFKDARKETIKEAVHILKNEDINLYEYSEEDFLKNTKEFNKKNIECLLLLVLANPSCKKSKDSLKMIVETLKKIKTEKCRHMALEIDQSINEEFKILLFIKFKKEEKKNDAV